VSKKNRRNHIPSYAREATGYKTPLIYVEETLSENEDIVGVGNFHWMFIFKSVLTASLYLIIALLIMRIGVIFHLFYPKIPVLSLPEIFIKISWVDVIKHLWGIPLSFRLGILAFIFFAVIQVAAAFIVKATTEIAITDRRIILKRGLIARHVKEMRVENVESAEVNQTIMGRLLNYGDVDVRGTGVGDINMPPWIDGPLEFRKAIQRARKMAHDEDNA